MSLQMHAFADRVHSEDAAETILTGALDLVADTINANTGALSE